MGSSSHNGHVVVPPLSATLIRLAAELGKPDEEVCEILAISPSTLKTYRWRMRRDGIEVPRTRWTRTRDETVRLVGEFTIAGRSDESIAAELGIQKISLAGYRADARKAGIPVPRRKPTGRPPDSARPLEDQPKWRKHLAELEERLANPPPMSVMLEHYWRLRDAPVEREAE